MSTKSSISSWHERALVLASTLTLGCFAEAPTSAEDESSSDATASSDASTSNDASSGPSSTSTSEATLDLESSSDGSSSMETGESTGTSGDVGPLPEPRALWRFEGDMVEEIASADAVAIGIVSFASSPWGEAAAPGLTAYIDASAIGPLVLEHKDAFSVLMRIRLDDHSGNQTLWSLGPASHMAAERNSMALFTLDGVLNLFTETGVAQVHGANIASSPAIGQWVEMVVVIDAGFIRIFIDGEIAGTSPFVPVETETTEFYIGGLYNTADPAQTISLHGAIDEVRIWDVALTEAHVAEVSEPG